MQRTLYIHIGTPKSGSTALQFFLEANRQTLSQSFALYPRATTRGGGHHDIALLLHGNYPAWATTQPKTLDFLWRDLESEVAPHQGDVLLSSENFYLFPEPKQLANRLASSTIFKDMCVKILVYLRPQDEIVEAWYNQIVKAQGYSDTFEQSIREYGECWDYDSGLRDWIKYFGQSNICVRIYRGGSGKQWDICTDFLEYFNLDPHSVAFPDKKPNTNLNRDLLEFQRIVNRLPLSPVEKRQFHKNLIELTTRTSGQGIFKNTPFLTFEERQKVRARYAASNARVAKTYFGRATLFPEIQAGGVEPPPYEGLDMESIVAIMGWILLKSK